MCPIPLSRLESHQRDFCHRGKKPELPEENSVCDSDSLGEYCKVKWALSLMSLAGFLHKTQAEFLSDILLSSATYIYLFQGLL